MQSQKRLFLLDAYALIFRGYYAFIKNPRINSKGMDTSAIMGFMNSLLDVIKREKPDHLAVAFDKGGSDYRLEMFEAYKANRDETPEAIKIAVPYIQELLRAMHIPIMEKAGEYYVQDGNEEFKINVVEMSNEDTKQKLVSGFTSGVSGGCRISF